MTFNSRYPWSFPWKRLRGERHGGIDYLCPISTPIKAPTKMQQYRVMKDHPDYGIVVYAYSLEVKGLEFVFGHLENYAWARVGKIVQHGEIFAWTGNSGVSTSPHCHFECRFNGVKVDPAKYM